jgi:hypothetical protein
MDTLTLFGLLAVTAMLVFYTLENRSPWYSLTPCAFSSSAGPMSDNNRSLGELIAPALTITSRRARAVSGRAEPWRKISAPAARPFSTTIRVVRTLVSTVRFLRAMAG